MRILTIRSLGEYCKHGAFSLLVESISQAVNMSYRRYKSQADFDVMC